VLLLEAGDDLGVFFLTSQVGVVVHEIIPSHRFVFGGLELQSGLHKRSSDNENSATEYDYVVVGSGAGGGPVAARLAMSSWSLLPDESSWSSGSRNNPISSVRIRWTGVAELEPMRPMAPSPWEFYTLEQARWGVALLTMP
jgi:hypothetical protein